LPFCAGLCKPLSCNILQIAIKRKNLKIKTEGLKIYKISKSKKGAHNLINELNLSRFKEMCFKIGYKNSILHPNWEQFTLERSLKTRSILIIQDIC